MTENKNKQLTNEEDALWKLITKKDKKYSSSNKFVQKNKSSEKKNITINKNKSGLTAIILKENKPSRKVMVERKVLNKEQELDPNKIPSGISLRQAERLLRGKIRPEEEIDLHGFTQSGAHNYLKEELTLLYKKNIRCILIITGKKIGKHGAEGVLRKEVPKWLNATPLRQMILMTSWAQARDGGDGALYVLLKKNR